MISFIYNGFIIPLTSFLIWILKRFNPKLAERQKNYKLSLANLRKLNLQTKSETKRIWFHSASMGEFEQAKSIIEAIKTENPNLQIVVSFFSPSGYNHQKDYEFLDAAFYLPIDTNKNAEELIELINPDAVVFIRYEIWHNFLRQIKNKNIPLFLVDATVPKRKKLFKYPFLKHFIITNYNYFTEIFTVGQEHTDFFSKLGVKSEISTLTDTRFDRIVEKVCNSSSLKLLPDALFKTEKFILVAGSTWIEDETIIFEAIEMLRVIDMIDLQIILVPHEPNKENLVRIQKSFKNYILLSNLINNMIIPYGSSSKKNHFDGMNLLVDSIGKLLGLYKYADFAYIGGGFGAGNHSVAEPAGYGLPICCGPRINNSEDAKALHQISSLTIVNNSNELYYWLKELIENPSMRKRKAELSKKYIWNNQGSSQIISDKILSKIQ